MTPALADLVRDRAAAAPDAPAYLCDDAIASWSWYHHTADRLASRLIASGLEPGDRVAVLLPDSADLHAAYVACERAGLVIVGIPVRAGAKERQHLLGVTGAKATISTPRDVVRIVPQDRPGPPAAVWLINATSGTTGLPKCVEQTQEKWVYLARQAVAAASLTGDDIIMSVVPGPFGYGLWTAHVLPALLGIPCVLTGRFSAEGTLRAAASHRVTVLACVTTQLRMMLASPVLDEVDLGALRVLYTGGERTPPEVAAEWERRTGSAVLQFYGSNEFGGFSGTSLADPAEKRLTTAGRVLPGVRYRLYDERGADVTASGGPGQPGGLAPFPLRGYYGDEAATAALFAPDGHQLLPDVVTVDDAGYVRIAGRKADFIIRGGKNISAAQVEAEVAAHPAVTGVAVVPVPDEVFGERVCAAVTLRGALTLDELRSFLTGRGVSKEYFPEHLVVLGELPVSMGGKIARKELRDHVLDILGLPVTRAGRDHA